MKGADMLYLLLQQHRESFKANGVYTVCPSIPFAGMYMCEAPINAAQMASTARKFPPGVTGLWTLSDTTFCVTLQFCLPLSVGK